jgi:hypothetical protein
LDIYKIPRIQGKLCIDAKIRENHLLLGFDGVVDNESVDVFSGHRFDLRVGHVVFAQK